MLLFQDGKVVVYEVGEGAGDEGDGAAVGGVVVGAVDVEDEAPDVAEQDGASTGVEQVVHEVQVGGDDSGAEGLRGLLIATVTLLFAY